MTQAEVEVAWGRDRRELRSCGEKHADLVAWASDVVHGTGPGPR